MTNICRYFTSKHKNNCITNNYSLRLKSKVNLNLINTTSINFVTGVTSSTTEHQQDTNSRQHTFTSINNQFLSSLLPHPAINVITVPPKIWREKTITKYKPIIYDDVDEDLYLFKPFGKCVKRSSSWELRIRSDLIHWNESLGSPELERIFCVRYKVDDFTRRCAISIIKTN